MSNIALCGVPELDQASYSMKADLCKHLQCLKLSYLTV